MQVKNVKFLPGEIYMGLAGKKELFTVLTVDTDSYIRGTESGRSYLIETVFVKFQRLRDGKVSRVPFPTAQRLLLAKVSKQD